MRSGRHGVYAGILTALGIGAGILTISAADAGPSQAVTLTFDTSNPLGARSGTLPDGRTFGPMPMPISAVRTPAEVKAFENAMPDLVPVIAADGQSIAGYADRVALESQGPKSPPIPVFGEDFVAVVGYWHFNSGFSTSSASPSERGATETSEAKP